MLQSLRDKSSSWIAKVILALLLIPFAFFGVEQYLSQRVDNYAARVSTPPTWWSAAPTWWPAKMLWKHQEIGVDEFRNQFERERQQRRAAEGEAFDARAFESAENKRSVLDKMIDERVMRIAAENAGIVIGDAEVRDTIQSLPDFQVDGKFDTQRYQLGLASLSPPKTPRQFEQLVRDSLQQSQVPSRLAESAFITSSELDRLLIVLGEKRDASFALLPAPRRRYRRGQRRRNPEVVPRPRRRIPRAGSGRDRIRRTQRRHAAAAAGRRGLVARSLRPGKGALRRFRAASGRAYPDRRRCRRRCGHAEGRRAESRRTGGAGQSSPASISGAGSRQFRRSGFEGPQAATWVWSRKA